MNDPELKVTPEGWEFLDSPGHLFMESLHDRGLADYWQAQIADARRLLEEIEQCLARIEKVVEVVNR